MLKSTYHKHILKFKIASGTSRGVLKTKETWFLVLKESDNWGIGECGILRGLSIDDRPDYEAKLKWVCENISLGKEKLYKELFEYPSIQSGIETAFMSLASVDPFQIFSSEFSQAEKGIPINGLVWMGDRAFMKKQISEKLEQGFSCIKMKIGAIDFASEIDLLKSIRREFTPSEIELRVDANGAFTPSEAFEKLEILSELELHSIEQPIKQGQRQEMAKLCEVTPLPIALDEELIGAFSSEEKYTLLEVIKPQFIIIKPSLIGGFAGSDSWIDLANELGIKWWVTSALESNVGLNAISQYTFTKNSKLPQGLGTGSLFSNNISSPLEIVKGSIIYNQTKNWNLDVLRL